MMNLAPQTPRFVSPENRYPGPFADESLPLVAIPPDTNARKMCSTTAASAGSISGSPVVNLMPVIVRTTRYP